MHKPAWMKILCALSVLSILAGLASAQDQGAGESRGTPGVAQPEQRVALVIGNDAYESAPLRNPVNDSRTMGKALEELGFQVTQKENLNQKEMKQEIQSFGQKLLKGGVGLFYYAGHGMQVGGRNYLIPVGARIEHENQVEYEGVDAGSLLAEMEYARNRLNIVILDACRDNPFSRSFRSVAHGLATMNAPTGTLIAYATSPGAVANDGPGLNGTYTGELIKVIETPGLKIEDVFKQVRSAVREASQGKQIPWEASSLEGDFYFRPPIKQVTAPVAIEKPAVLPPQTQLSRSDHSPRAVKIWKEPVSGMEFVWVPAGCFLMGSPQTEPNRDVDEGPVHEVCVKGYWLGKTEVTNGQYRKFQPDHSSRNYEGHSLNGDTQPAVYVSWEDARSFAQWLMEQNGGQYKFRLPTEAEWEYAARAGSQAARYWGDDPVRACEFENVADQSAKKLWNWEETHDCDDGYAATAPVASFQPNVFGLYDMLGNVWEWCEDVYSVEMYANYDRNSPVNLDISRGPDRVVRGGFWHAGPQSVRSSDRGSGLPTAMNDDLGFRLVREP
ncbi:MAG: SUMF1/EgtB/PvdO family nonheme iron enzyme [Syntrophobacteraceae bacterium]